jgi:hypothetical protein
MGTYLYELGKRDTIYTVSKNPRMPISAINGEGEDVLSEIAYLDGVYTIGHEFQYDVLELDLGNLSEAETIKLVVAGITDYSDGKTQGEWAEQFWNKPRVKPFPPPYMEVKAANGSWISVPDNRQFPLVDVTADSFVVDLTGLFPTNNYSLRIYSFFDVQFDYIGVDTTSQQEVIVQTIEPTFAKLEQITDTNSISSGFFTRYGDVTQLVLSPDDEFVIGRQGDSIHLKFDANELNPISEGMERDYFFFACLWFKVDGLPYLPFTVDPLPFHNMSSFPYPDTENYPYEAHATYLKEYNTRAINIAQEEITPNESD